MGVVTVFLFVSGVFEVPRSQVPNAWGNTQVREHREVGACSVRQNWTYFLVAVVFGGDCVCCGGGADVDAQAGEGGRGPVASCS